MKRPVEGLFRHAPATHRVENNTVQVLKQLYKKLTQSLIGNVLSLVLCSKSQRVKTKYSIQEVR